MGEQGSSSNGKSTVEVICEHSYGLENIKKRYKISVKQETDETEYIRAGTSNRIAQEKEFKLNNIYCI